MLNNLQALRAFAALSVVFFHFSLVPASAMPFHPGIFGVDLFFVLSGFIIAYSADRDSRHFLAHRLIRVLPTYWIVTSIGGALVIAVMPFGPAVEWYGQSLLFLTSPEGRPPIILVGWTLVYELVFYLIYAIMLGAGRKAAPFLAIPVLAALAFALPYTPLALRTWPLLIEFCYGLLIFLIVKSWHAPGAGARKAALLLVVVGLVLIYAFDGDIRALKGLAQETRRIVVLGIPAALIVLGLVVMEKAGWTLKSRIVLALGAASYAMYLLHPLVFAAVLQLKPGSFETRLEVFGVLTLVTLALSLGFYYAVESPLLRLLRRKFTHDAPPAVQMKDAAA